MRATMTAAATATTATVETARIIAFRASGYLEKRPRPKKPKRTNTTMTMMTIKSQVGTSTPSVSGARRLYSSSAVSENVRGTGRASQFSRKPRR
jgi:hypothetical protein